MGFQIDEAEIWGDIGDAANAAWVSDDVEEKAFQATMPLERVVVGQFGLRVEIRIPHGSAARLSSPKSVGVPGAN